MRWVGHGSPTVRLYQQYFAEDTILITRGGHEILNPALPYSPSDIEREMAKKK